MKILVIQQKMIGDVLTTSIVFKALKDRYPNAKLYYLINTHTFSVVDQNPYIDHVIFFTKDIESSKAALFKFARTLKQEQFDVVIDVYSKLSSNIISLLSGAHTKISYHKYYTAFIYSHNIKRKVTATTTDGLAIEHRLQLLEPLDIYQESATPKIYLSENEIRNSATLLEHKGLILNEPLYMISVLGSGSNKTYPSDFMAQVIDTVVETTKGQILFNYIPIQLSEAQAIYDLCQPESKKHIYFDVFGNNLRDFLAITHHCNALIGNEGGAVNMAKALNVRTFAIFSPWIDTATWGGSADENHVNVHLKMYNPKLYKDKVEKAMKKDALALYKSFKPEFFIEKLKKFLN